MTALIWAAVRPWLKSLNLWMLLVIGALCVVIWLGHGRLQERKAAAAKAEEMAWAAKGTVTAATATANAERAATDATPLPADRKAIEDLCRRSASCRERGQK